MTRLKHKAVNHMFSMLPDCLFVILVIFNFVFDGRILVLIVPVPGHCLSFTSSR